jgi:hypothetical protein
VNAWDIDLLQASGFALLWPEWTYTIFVKEALKARLGGLFGIMPIWVIRIGQPEFCFDGSREVRPRGSS